MAQQSPIDHALEQCLSGAATTVAMVTCYGSASQAWDGEMNRHYNQLMKTLTGEPKTKLRSAQRQWLAYRNSWQAASAASFTARKANGADICRRAGRRSGTQSGADVAVAE